jgi:phenazine biosynthesis protein phzE
VTRLRELAEFLLAAQTPLVAECLGHQVLAGVLGLPLIRRDVPNQGTQREVSLFGRPELVGFYNSYAARYTGGQPVISRAGGETEVCADERTGEVHALRGPGFASTQFHLESVLTRQGVHILADLLSWAARGAPRQAMGATEREAG